MPAGRHSAFPQWDKQACEAKGCRLLSVVQAGFTCRMLSMAQTDPMGLKQMSESVAFCSLPLAGSVYGAVRASTSAWALKSHWMLDLLTTGATPEAVLRQEGVAWVVEISSCSTR